MVEKKETAIGRFISRYKWVSMSMAFVGGVVSVLGIAPNALTIWNRFSASQISVSLVSTPGSFRLARNITAPSCPLSKGSMKFIDIGTTEVIDEKCNAVFADIAISVHNPTKNKTTITSCKLEISFSGTSFRMISDTSVPITEFKPHYLGLGRFERVVVEAGSVADSELVFFFLVSPEVRKYLNSTIYRGVHLSCFDVSGGKYTTEFVQPDMCNMGIPEAGFCKLLKENNMT